MRGLVRHIMALLCLVAYICSGQLNACACSMETPAPSQCETHDHSAGHHHSEPGSSSEAGCPCVACHACNHAQVVMPAVEVLTFGVSTEPIVGKNDVPLAALAAEIFTPPKLS